MGGLGEDGVALDVAVEVEAQAAAGWSTLLVSSAPLGLPLLRMVRAGLADVAVAGTAAHGRLAVLRPSCLDPEAWPCTVDAPRAVVVAGPDVDDPGSRHERLSRHFPAVIWAPATPAARRILEHEGAVPLSEDDWDVVLTEPASAPAPAGGGRLVVARPRIGDDAWPENLHEILAAYPTAEDVDVRMPDDVASVVRRVGYVPTHWVPALRPSRLAEGAHAFVAAAEERDLLADSGRAVLTAAATGIPVLVADRPRLVERFGEAVVPVPSSRYEATARLLHQDPQHRIDVVERASAHLRNRHGRDAHAARIARAAGEPARPPLAVVATPRPRPRARVLLLSSNGAGLGHVTRLMAVGRRLPDDVEAVVATQSQAAPLVQRAGFLTEYVPSRGYLGITPGHWNRYFHDRLHHLLDRHSPDLVVMDGPVPYGGLLLTMHERRDVAWVWMRRAMWKPGMGSEWIRRGASFDHVLEPGDLAEEADRGVTVAERDRVHRVGPMTFLDPEELVDRPTALAALGLDDRVTALLQFGAGNINDIQSPSGRMASRLLSAGVQVVLAQSPIASHSLEAPAGARVVVEYPISRYLRAFDFAISAGGYNSVHELLGFGVPSVLVPNHDTAMDDQVTRVAHAARQGSALQIAAPETDETDRVLERILDPTVRDGLAARCDALAVGNGAGKAAAWIDELLRTRTQTGA